MLWRNTVHKYCNRLWGRFANVRDEYVRLRLMPSACWTRTRPCHKRHSQSRMYTSKEKKRRPRRKKKPSGAIDSFSSLVFFLFFIFIYFPFFVLSVNRGATFLSPPKKKKEIVLFGARLLSIWAKCTVCWFVDIWHVYWLDSTHTSGLYRYWLTFSIDEGWIYAYVHGVCTFGWSPDLFVIKITTNGRWERVSWSRYRPRVFVNDTSQIQTESFLPYGRPLIDLKWSSRRIVFSPSRYFLSLLVKWLIRFEKVRARFQVHKRGIDVLAKDRTHSRYVDMYICCR